MAPSSKARFSSLSETDKDRLLAVLYASDTSKTDWTKAAKIYGSTSVAGFRVCYAESKKKLHAALKAEDDGEATATPTESVKTHPRKRKAPKAQGVDEAEKPKRGRKSKKTDAQSATAETSAVTIKQEPADAQSSGDSYETAREDAGEKERPSDGIKTAENVDGESAGMVGKETSDDDEPVAKESPEVKTAAPKQTGGENEVAEESNGKSDAIDTQQGSVIANEVDVADAVDIIIEDSDFV